MQVYDLLCYTASGDLCRVLPGRKIGVPDPVRYDCDVSWHVGERDDTHYAVRLMRYLPNRATATAFVPEEWGRCHYPMESPPSHRHLALAPGCGIENRSKRWPMESWLLIAAWAINRGMVPVWFLGPHERDLVDDARRIGGDIVAGDWGEVIAQQSRCALGVTNDTVHLHVRAHLAVHTVALFITSAIAHWGDYPHGVKCLHVGPTHSSDAVRDVIQTLSGWN